MFISKEFQSYLEKELQNQIDPSLRIEELLPVHGGDSHSTFRIHTSRGDYFLKTSDHIPEDLFQKEFEGLQLLKKQSVIGVVHPLSFGKYEKHRFLLLHFLEKGSPKTDFWDVFAKGLAALHRNTRDQFGLDEDNYLGRRHQSNTSVASWSEFYITQRIAPLIKACRDKNLLEKRFSKMADHLYNRMDDIFPQEPPALLHGDLWAGNFLCGADGRAWIFDPAVYYGNREMDLAMTRLFGGFDADFYSSYNQYFPLIEDWEKRIRICQLYPLLIHALHFGGGYVGQVKTILNAYD